MPTEETRFIMESQNVIDQQRAGREDGANQPEECEKTMLCQGAVGYPSTT